MNELKIALVGKVRSGKDTVAEYYIDKYGMVPFAFGNPLKASFHKEYPHIGRDPKPVRGYQLWGQLQRYVQGEDVWIKKVEREIAYNREVSKNYRQRDGSAIAFSPIITDVRQQNEVDWCKANGYTLIRVNTSEDIRIERMKALDDNFDESVFNFETETELDNFEVDYDVDNSGTLESLYGLLEDIIKELQEPKYLGDNPSYESGTLVVLKGLAGLQGPVYEVIDNNKLGIISMQEYQRKSNPIMVPTITVQEAKKDEISRYLGLKPGTYVASNHLLTTGSAELGVVEEDYEVHWLDDEREATDTDTMLNLYLMGELTVVTPKVWREIYDFLYIWAPEGRRYREFKVGDLVKSDEGQAFIVDGINEGNETVYLLDNKGREFDSASVSLIQTIERRGLDA